MTAPLLGLLIPNSAIGNAFLGYGFACVAIAGICGANTVMTRIIHIQTVPAALGLVAMYLALNTRTARPYAGHRTTKRAACRYTPSP